MSSLPLTPDFDYWPIAHTIEYLNHTDEALNIIWSDGAASAHHALLLRENSTDPVTTHPKAREMAITPAQIPADVAITAVKRLHDDAVSVTFSDGVKCDYHPGWLRGVAWFKDDESPPPVLWRGKQQPEPPTVDGVQALQDPAVFLAWLEGLRDYGVSRLRGLPLQDGLLEEIVTKIGPVRESNFGRLFVLKIKDDPDSQAYTSEALPPHIDLPTREVPPGLQFLYIRENSTNGGEGVFVDSYQIAEDMRHEEPAHFFSLTSDYWEYNNRARVSDYRACGPVVETDARGNITSVRYNTFLRAPLKAPLPVQARAYRAYRAFCVRAQESRYEMKFRYEAGDLVAFDNRRALHGRAGYDAKGGVRFIEGAYADRDDLYSRIRTITRLLQEQRQS